MHTLNERTQSLALHEANAYRDHITEDAIEFLHWFRKVRNIRCEKIIDDRVLVQNTIHDIDVQKDETRRHAEITEGRSTQNMSSRFRRYDYMIWR